MSKHHRYFDSSGREVDERAATRNGILRDSYTMRIPTMFRDAAMSDSRGPRFVDGSGNPLDLGAGGRPGFRVRAGDAASDSSRQAVRDSYFRADMLARNRWKVGDLQTQCTTCFGEGVDEDGEECSVCKGSGVLPDQRSESKNSGGSGYGSGNEGGYGDRRRATGDTAARDKAYSDYDKSISEQWRNG